MLKEISFLPSYFKTRNELFEEFYKPCMENSISYDRITGFFGSSVFIVINKALKNFIENGGKIRLVCSPVLKEEDFKAMKEGYENKNNNVLLSTYLNDVFNQLTNSFPNSTLLLSRLIATGILEIRLAIFGENPQAKRLLHDKAGVFTDKYNNSVAFRGSINETFKGVSEFGNSESFDVYTSWENSKDRDRLNLIVDHFNKIWNGTERNIRTYKIPQVSLEKINTYYTEKSIDELLDEVEIELYLKDKWYAESGVKRRKVRKHQEEILNNWKKNDRKGLFEMCTGSGKTFTSLCAIREAVYEKNEVPLILVPSKLLFNQWKKEITKVFPNINLLLVGSGNKANSSLLKIYSDPKIKRERCILATYSSAHRDTFINNINWGNHIFMVCDEVHNIGSSKNQKLLDVDVGPRIGLSATPKRYFDEYGTHRIITFFNGVIEPKYQIQDAIRDGVLSEYFYSVNEVELELHEQKKWNELTQKINKLIAINHNSEQLDDVRGLDRLLFQRADIVKKARGKINVAEEILLKHFKRGQRWLVYLDDTEHLNQLKDLLLKHEQLKDYVLEYHTNADVDLQETIKYFTNYGAILLSINCLDEGVDIPEIDYAIILASSKNPRQYVQRRGRVLRKSKNKPFANIFDCLVIPNNLEKDIDKNLSIINGEIARAKEFASRAINGETTIKYIQILMNKFNIDTSEMEGGIDE